MSNPLLKIAVDAMGGDFAPMNEIQGAIMASTLLSETTPIEIVFFGKEQEIRSALSKQTLPPNFRYSIIHTDEVITMEDDPTVVLRKKRNSSMIVGINAHKDAHVDAFISAGNTGAVMSAATVILGRINGVSRPTIGAFFPTQQKDPCLLLDVGANVDSKPKHLVEFCIMGSIYIQEILGIKNPKVGLLNIGEEESKGNEVAIETLALLKESPLNFIGNVEGRDIFQGTAHLIVTDGFTGNIVLKFAESFLGTLKVAFKQFAQKSIWNKLMVGLIVAPIMKKVLKSYDYQEYGGVPLLGVNGVVIIGHGKSTPLAIQNMILRAVESKQKNINDSIRTSIQQYNMSIPSPVS